MKRGQTSLFIVLAVVIVIIGLLAIYISYYVIGERERSEFDVSGIPERAKPVEETILFCLQDVLIDGVELAQQQGGVIDPNIKIDSDANKNYFENYGIPIKKWKYRNGDILEYEFPEIEQIEQELEEYIKIEGERCFTNLSYEESIIAEPTKDVDVQIKRDNIYLNFEKTLNIQIDDSRISVDDHDTQIESEFLVLHETAKRLVENERETYYLENLTLDIISVYDEIPFEDNEISCDTKTWSKIDVEKFFKQAVETNFLQIRLGDNDYYAWDVEAGDDTNLIVTYNKRWPVTMEIEPSSGNILKSNVMRGSGVGAFVCLNQYKFVYSVLYPVVLKIERDGEIMQIAMDVVIVENDVEREDRPIIENEPNLICDFANQQIELDVYDSFELNSITNYDAKLRCGTTECRIQNDLFPQCVGGSIIVEAEGYANKKINDISTVEFDKIEVPMDRIYTIPVEVRANTISGDRELEENEIAVINLAGDEHQFTLTYPEQNTIEMGAVDYELTGQLILDEARTINGGKVTQCINVPRENILGVLGLEKQECVETQIEDLTVDNLMVGNSYKSVYLTDFDLRDAQKIIIYVEHTGIPRNYEDLQNQETVEMRRYLEVI